MAIAHGSTTVATGSANSITISNHVVSGKNPVLIVKVAMQRGAATAVTGITWNGTENLVLVKKDNNNDAFSELWYLANPTIKTADVVISIDSSPKVVGAASTYTGAHKEAPLRIAEAVSADGTDGSPTVSIEGINTDMIVDSLAQASAGPDTAVGDHTERHDDSATGVGNDIRGASQEKICIGDTIAMGWTMSDSDSWAICAVPIRTPLSDGYMAMSHAGLVEPPSGW